MPHLQKINSFQWHSTKIKRGNTCLDSQNSRLSSRLRLSENNTQKRRRRRYKTSHQYFSRVTMHYQMILVSLKYSTFENIYKFTKLSNIFFFSLCCFYHCIDVIVFHLVYKQNRNKKEKLKNG